ncbi:MAG TPA: VCBS repeat-containing protein [Chloroflexia bacterium]|nr:VCBS repeat-containing protein [Chloroflexia bacterium]
MAVNRAAARSWVDEDEAEAPPIQTKQRAWASHVPYDIIEDAPAPLAPAPPAARARRGPASSTQRLYAMPSGREQVTYRPPQTMAPPAAPAGNYERVYSPRPGHPASTVRVALFGLGAAATAVLLYLVVSTLVTWTQIKLDDITYGNPRTTHLDAVVGNGDSADQPTHFIALNLNRQVSIIELPGGDISKAVAISGPYLFGDGEDLTPVKMQVEDINGDGKPDLLVTVKNEELAYINDKGSFRPITADEKAKLDAAAASPPAAGK